MFKRSLVALITPFKNNAIDVPALKHLIEWHIGEGTHALVVCGSTGEGFFLSAHEHAQVVKTSVECAKGRIPIIASTGAMTTQDAFVLSVSAQNAGANALMIVTPPYVKPTQEGLYQHYLALHDATTIPLMIYNIPSRTGGLMQNETLARLAQLPRIAAVKDSTDCLSRPCAVRALVGERISQLSGDDATALGFLAQGGHGCISVVANVAPHLCAQMHDAWQGGDLAKAFELRDMLYPLTQALFMESNPSPVKYALSLLGKCTPTVRAPLMEISVENQRAVRSAMEHAGLLLTPLKGVVHA